MAPSTTVVNEFGCNYCPIWRTRVHVDETSIAGGLGNAGGFFHRRIFNVKRGTRICRISTPPNTCFRWPELVVVNTDACLKNHSRMTTSEKDRTRQNVTCSGIPATFVGVNRRTHRTRTPRPKTAVIVTASRMSEIFKISQVLSINGDFADYQGDYAIHASPAAVTDRRSLFLIVAHCVLRSEMTSQLRSQTFNLNLKEHHQIIQPHMCLLRIP